jgi:hypothetical protein
MPDTATSATLLYDQVGSGVDGTMYNGTCLNFDGTDDELYLKSDLTMNGAVSLLCWISTTSGARQGYLSNRSGGPVGSAWGMASGKLSYYYYIGPWREMVSTSAGLDDGNWHHVAIIRSSDNYISFFIDGALDKKEQAFGNRWCNIDNSGGYPSATTTLTVDNGSGSGIGVQMSSGNVLYFAGGATFTLNATALAGATSITSDAGLTASVADNELGQIHTSAVVGSNCNNIGAYWNNSSEFDGSMADFKCFDGLELTPPQVKELYDDSRVVIPYGASFSDLSLWYPMSEGVGDICYDGGGEAGSSLNPGTAQAGNTWLTGQTGPPQLVEGYNRPAVFDATDYVTAAGPAVTGDMSVSVWIYRFSQGAYAGVVSKMGASGSGDGWFLRFDASNNLEFMIQRSGSATGEATASASINAWHHVVGTNDGTNLKVYVDGSLASTVSSGGATTDSGTVLQMATYGWNVINEYSFIGIVNEVIVYDKALSLAEVQVLAATGPNGGPLPPDPMALADSGNVVGYWRNDGDATWTDRSSNSNTGTVYGLPDALLFKQGYNGSGSTSAGRDNQGFPLLCQNNGAIGFNGSSDYVAIGNDTPTQIGGLGSLEAWVFQAQDKWMYFYWKGYGTNNSLYLGFHTTGGGKWFFGSYYSGYKYIYWRGVGQSDYAASFANRWHYLTMTYDKTLASDNWKVYHNGVYAAAADWTNDLGTSGNVVHLAGSRRWVGQIGPIKLYDRVLSPSEITQNFNAQRSRFGI